VAPLAVTVVPSVAGVLVIVVVVVVLVIVVLLGFAAKPIEASSEDVRN
jgi:hypothetical protein